MTENGHSFEDVHDSTSIKFMEVMRIMRISSKVFFVIVKLKRERAFLEVAYQSTYQLLPKRVNGLFLKRLLNFKSITTMRRTKVGNLGRAINKFRDITELD